MCSFRGGKTGKSRGGLGDCSPFHPNSSQQPWFDSISSVRHFLFPSPLLCSFSCLLPCLYFHLTPSTPPHPPAVPASPGSRVKATLSKCSVWTWLHPSVPEPTAAVPRLQRLTDKQDGLLWLVSSIWFCSGGKSITQSSHQHSVWSLSVSLLFIRWRRTQRQQRKVRRHKRLLSSGFSEPLAIIRYIWKGDFWVEQSFLRVRCLDSSQEDLEAPWLLILYYSSNKHWHEVSSSAEAWCEHTCALNTPIILFFQPFDGQALTVGGSCRKGGLCPWRRFPRQREWVEHSLTVVYGDTESHGHNHTPSASGGCKTYFQTR